MGAYKPIENILLKSEFFYEFLFVHVILILLIYSLINILILIKQYHIQIIKKKKKKELLQQKNNPVCKTLQSTLKIA